MNLIQSSEPKNFFIFINLDDPFINHNLTLTGCFVSTPTNPNSENLMFIPNPNFQGFVSPFQNNLMRNYLADYNLEMTRRSFFSRFPSRLESIFLFDSEDEATKYLDRHGSHVGDRQLQKVQSNGKYVYSIHDSSWIDFMRINHAMDQQTIESVTKSYWEGKNAIDFQHESHGKYWASNPIREVLFLGRINFPKDILK